MLKKVPINKRLRPEDPRNMMYLKSFRESVDIEQAQKYYDVRTKHTITSDDFKAHSG